MSSASRQGLGIEPVAVRGHQGLAGELHEHAPERLKDSLQRGPAPSFGFRAASSGRPDENGGRRRRFSILRPSARRRGDLGREVRSLFLLDALAEGEAHEALQGHRLAGLRLGFLQHLGDGLRRIVHEGLLQEGDLLVVALQAALDDLLHHVVGLAGVLLAQDGALALDRGGIDAGGVERERVRRRDVHGDLAAERPSTVTSPSDSSATSTPILPRPSLTALWT
jgi:hypothetical protein